MAKEPINVVQVESWLDFSREQPGFTGCLIDKQGDIAWYKDGKFHREDGPAICFFESSHKAWYLNGNGYTEKEWKLKVRKIKFEKHFSDN
jgi:hypothetical protein